MSGARFEHFSPVHLYVHVPFCARRCSYCDFAIAVRRRDLSVEFAAAIVAEWQAWLDAPWWAEVGPIETVYFGGGTPSRVSPDAIAAILETIGSTREIRADAEITLEANPEDVDRIRATRWAALGVTRVSLGVQSFAPAALAWMHRVHGAEAPGRAVRFLREAGFDNISVDLIYGLPATLDRDWAGDLDRALALAPTHVSLYGLTVEPGTPLGKWVARGEAVPAADAHAADEYLAAHRVLEGAGFRHYEVSNAGKPGFESRHNAAYWQRRSYLGLGPSAHSAHGDRRWWNTRDWEAYRRALPTRGRVLAGEERLTPDQVALEELYLGLRTTRGIRASSLPEPVAQGWLAAGWARRDGSWVTLTPDGWLRLDALVRQVDGV